MVLMVLSLLGFGCKKDEPEEPKTVKMTTLLYAVNGNNLYTNLETNMRQIESAMRSLPNGEYSIVLYKTDSPSTTSLSRIISGPNAAFETIREYSRDRFATDPEMLSSIISDFSRIDNTAKDRNLIMWGHGMAWTPFFSEHNVTRATGIPGEYGSYTQPDLHAFGGDDNQRDWMDIDEMAGSIPSGMFGLIIFDCCYMSNIETLYQIRDKADYVIAYPTEIASYGLPYDRVLPHICKDTPDYSSAAEAIYDFYEESRIAVTVSVVDMSEMKGVARAVKAIYTGSTELPSTLGLLNYSRTVSCPYYDLGQTVKEIGTLNDKTALIPDFENALNKMIVYTKASERDFNGRVIPVENYHGISTHLFRNSGSKEDEYYKTLDWYKAVYE